MPRLLQKQNRIGSNRSVWAPFSLLFRCSAEIAGKMAFLDPLQFPCPGGNFPLLADAGNSPAND